MIFFCALFQMFFLHILKQSITFRYPPSRLQTLHSNLLFMPPSFYHPDPAVPPFLHTPFPASTFLLQATFMLQPASTSLLRPFRSNISFCHFLLIQTHPLQYSSVHPPPPQFSQPPLSPFPSKYRCSRRKTPTSNSTSLYLQSFHSKDPHAPHAFSGALPRAKMSYAYSYRNCGCDEL